MYAYINKRTGTVIHVPSPCAGADWEQLSDGSYQAADAPKTAASGATTPRRRRKTEADT